MDTTEVKALIAQANIKLLDEIKKLLDDRKKEMIDAIKARTMELVCIIEGLEAKIEALTAMHNNDE